MSTESSANGTQHPGTAQDLILVAREGATTHVTLNRPRAINALNSVMFAALTAALAAAAEDGSASVLLDGAGERGFCGGGDIKELSTGDTRAILASEYRLNYAISESPVPVVCVMDGIAMGGGIGLGGHAAQRVVTERSRLAMPEARIGIAPDVGGNLLLARAPGRLGELLAVTAGEMTGGDAIALGFADWFIASEKLPELRAALVAGEDPEDACARLASPSPASALLAEREWWDPVAEGALAGGVFRPLGDAAAAGALRLIEALEDPQTVPAAARDRAATTAATVQERAATTAATMQERAATTAATVREMCPTSIAVALAQLDRTRRDRLDLAAVLTDDLRVLGRLGPRADFAEGVRAQVIDKDRNPRWSPARIEDLDPAELAAILDPTPRPGEHPLSL
ncbi:enoyl-CoA hydratase/isomerase family protein [Leucobacter luti]|uniref:enoyl-CoA hydratase/isomerase family protein n=1 Tax=Leucobacter luti TaxID=340320 RepID=UPI003CFC294E